MRAGHAPGHIRDMFLEAIDTYAEWSGEDDLPTVEHEIRYQPHQISLAKACGLLWNCADILPGDAFNALNQVLEEPIRRQTYAAAARAMLRNLKMARSVEFRRID